MGLFGKSSLPGHPAVEQTIGLWHFRQCGEASWRNASTSTNGNQVHLDLLENGDISDPFIDMNEKSVQWVGENDWEYQTTFDVSDAASACLTHEMHFDGLDTFCAAALNGTEILRSDNMFRGYVVDVTKHIKEKDNELVLVFKSALKKGRELEKKNGVRFCSNGETSRVHVRKAQYHYGWDWGPLLMTCGPWKPVRLVSFSAGKFLDFFPRCSVDSDLKATINFEVEVEVSGTSTVFVDTFAPTGEIIDTVEQKIKKSGVANFKHKLKNPKLWYPKGYGEQSRYRFSARLVDGNNFLLDTKDKLIGLRRAELVQEKVADEKGLSFYFRINNIPVFCAGSNWIPAHSFTCKLTEKDYKEWMQLVDEGNQNMVRVWGGGIYEYDWLYEECDKRGILVWQDFMFGCAVYPGDKEFVQNVKEEVEYQVKRLRQFCSIVIYAGNNEDYQVAELLGIRWDSNDLKKNYSKTEFPARTLYEVVFPKLVSSLTDVAYHKGSPYSPGHNIPTSDQTVGDLHQWNVWHGSQEKYQDWYKLGGRFVSEFGMLAFPNVKTIDKYVTTDKDKYPQLEVMDHHNKSDGFERRLALYVMENFHVQDMRLKNWVYITQLMQLECLAYAYRCWRRNWGRDGKRASGGALVWQTNDCWPVTSWAIIDFFRVPKLAYYAVKRESQPLALGIYRNEVRIANEGEPDLSKQTPYHDYAAREYYVDIWGVNSSLFEFQGVLRVEIYDSESGNLVKKLNDKNVLLAANQTTEIISRLHLPDFKQVVLAKLVGQDGNIAFKAGDWPQPLKYIRWPEDTKIDVLVAEDGIVKITANKLVKGVELITDSKLNDNGFDLYPNETHVVLAPGIKAGEKIEINYLK